MFVTFLESNCSYIFRVIFKNIMLTSLPMEKCSNMGLRTLFRVVKSSRLPEKIAAYLVRISRLLCLAFLIFTDDVF